MYRIGIDLGGTNIAAGLVDGSLNIIDRESVKTNLPTNIDRILQDITGLIHALMNRNALSREDIISVGVGVPCTADEWSGYMEDASHLGFERASLVQPLRQRLNMPVYIGNDANAAAWGEYMTCGYDAGSFILVTLGTGIGGGIILNRKLWSGANFAAGELGHMVIHTGGAQCSCGRRGCFEAYGSATALIRQAREHMESDSDTLLWQRCRGDIDKVEAKTVFDAASRGDRASRQLLDDYTTYLAEGIANIINIFQPEIVCIGGGVSAAGDDLILPLREKVLPMLYTRNAPQNARIIPARLGNDAGIIGAAMLGT